MSVLAFDTFAAVTRLKEAGFTEAQAKGVVDTFRSADTSELATKADIKSVRAYIETLCGEMQAEFKAIRGEMQAEFKAVRGEMRELELRMDARFEKVFGEMTLLKWMFGLQIAGIVALILKAYFPH